MIVWRSGLLAAWATSWLSGQVPLDDVVETVVGDETHRALLPGQDPTPLGWALTELRRSGETRLHAVFPDAGDPAGIPPGPAIQAATFAGEAVVAPQSGLVLVPSRAEEADVDVVWTAFTTEVRLEYISPAEAAFELAEVVRDSTDRLSTLDVAPWDPERGRIAMRRLQSAPTDVLPPGYPSRAAELLHRTGRLTGVLSAAQEDPAGGAVNGWEARARIEALVPLRRAVRRALTAAYNSAPYADR